MASGTNKKGPAKGPSKGSAQRSGKGSVNAARGSVVTKKQTPWGTIIAVVAILALAGGVFGYYLVQSADKREQGEQAEAFAPSPENPDPSTKIDGIAIEQYSGGAHDRPTDRVAYDQAPPFGGPHDSFWAACNGIVYEQAVRTENMVHSLEHGTVWITYNPDQVTGQALESLKDRVAGTPYMMLSPYPALDSPISLQSWGHQLKVERADDVRISQFISALRLNRNTYPEVGASCDALGPGRFDPDNPPPFNPEPPGPDAVPMDFTGSAGAAGDGQVAPMTGG